MIEAGKLYPVKEVARDPFLELSPDMQREHVAGMLHMKPGVERGARELEVINGLVAIRIIYGADEFRKSVDKWGKDHDGCAAR